MAANLQSLLWDSEQHPGGPQHQNGQNGVHYNNGGGGGVGGGGTGGGVNVISAASPRKFSFNMHGASRTMSPPPPPASALPKRSSFNNLPSHHSLLHHHSHHHHNGGKGQRRHSTLAQMLVITKHLSLLPSILYRMRMLTCGPLNHVPATCDRFPFLPVF